MASTRREILAGVSTFFTMAYLLLLYPQMMSDGGIDFGAALTGTIIVLVLSTLFLALYANFPVVLAPGLSVGPYLIYSVIQKQHASWEAALGIVFWVGLALLLLSLFKVRQKILLHLPPAIKAAAIGGIGLFLICVGLKDLGILIPTNGFFQIGAIVTAPNGIALFGLLLFFFLHSRKISSAFLISILAGWLAAVVFELTHWNGFAALPSSPLPVLFHLDLWTPLQPEWIGTILSVLLIALFDSSAALTALAKLAHATDDRGRIHKIDRILIPDGVGGMAAAIFGVGNLSFLLESSSGIKAGGRTGLTAIVAALCCLVCLFLYPLISSIPLFATAPALIAIGLFMAQETRSIRWRDPSESIPALLTLATIPLTFSIYKGFSIGFISYAILKILKREWKQVHPLCWILAALFALHFIWTIR